MKNKNRSSNAKDTQTMQVIITVFYGQFLSTAIFENLIRTIPDLIDYPEKLEEGEENITLNSRLELILRVCMGAIIIILSVFSLYAVWTRHSKLVMFSGIFLFAIFITTLLIATIQLTLKFQIMTSVERFKLVAKLSVETIFQLVGISATFQINLLNELENQNKVINVLINHVDLLQTNFNCLIPELRKSIKFEDDLMIMLEDNIQKAKSLKKKEIKHLQPISAMSSTKELNKRHSFRSNTSIRTEDKQVSLVKKRDENDSD